MSPGHLSALVSQTCLLHQVTVLPPKRPSSLTPTPHTPDTTEQVQCTICMEDNTMTSHLSRLAKATLPVSVPLKSKRSVSTLVVFVENSFTIPPSCLTDLRVLRSPWLQGSCRCLPDNDMEKLRGKLCQESISLEPFDQVIMLNNYFRWSSYQVCLCKSKTSFTIAHP